jgi:hypothetical protein
MTVRTWAPWTALLFLVAALIVMIVGGFVTFWNGDVSEQMSITRISWSATSVIIAAASAAVACVAALWRRGAMRPVFFIALVAALFAWGTRRGVRTEAAAVNDFRDGVGCCISSPITRAMTDPFTSVDPEPLDTAWAYGTALLLIGAAVAGWSAWRLRRAERRA